MSALPEAERVQMGDRGRAFFEAHFTREAVLPVYVSTLQQCIERPAASVATMGKPLE